MNIFTKQNSSSFDDALLKEAQGLELLRNTLKERDILEISIPRVMEVNSRLLKLEPIKQSIASNKQMALLGQGLAKLHRVQFESFGLELDNYIGLNPQHNGLSNSWAEFFIEKRLRTQVSFIKDKYIRSEFENTIETACSALKDFFSKSHIHPSLVHGDLWSGNVLFDSEKIWLIDPAVYYADREVDIAMTEMFGGFTAYFYDAYEEYYPLSTDYPIKRDIYNFYHYLNHYNLFGNTYLSACKRSMQVIRDL